MPRFIILSEPRTGSTYLMSLLNVHFEVNCEEELLGKQKGPRKDPLGDVNRQLSGLRQPVVGFKAMPLDLLYHQLTIRELVRRLKVKWVIVIWRENCLEMYASLQIALRTGVWWSEKPKKKAEVVKVKGRKFMRHLVETERRWNDVVRGWPLDVVPIFVKYEELVRNTTSEMRRILRCMTVDPLDYVFQGRGRRQNPAPVSQKVSTWEDLTENERSASVDIPSIVNGAISRVARDLNIPKECVYLLPDREPPSPPAGWLYRVSESYVTGDAGENVVDVVDCGSVSSSAARWPQEMSGKLKKIFGTPVAALLQRVCSLCPDA